MSTRANVLWRPVWVRARKYDAEADRLDWRYSVATLVERKICVERCITGDEVGRGLRDVQGRLYVELRRSYGSARKYECKRGGGRTRRDLTLPQLQSTERRGSVL